MGPCSAGQRGAEAEAVLRCLAVLHLGALQAEVVCLAYQTIAPPGLARCRASLP